MDVIREKYKGFEYEECVELLKKEAEGESGLVDHLVTENCLNVCQCLLIIAKDDRERINKMQKNLYKSYEKIIALGLPGDLIPVQVELTTLFNFMWWTVYYVNFNDNIESDTKGYLPVIQRGLRRVLGTSCKTNNLDRILCEILCDASSIGSRFKFKDSNTLSLIMEIVVLLLLFILKVDCSRPIVEQCLDTIDIVTNDAESHLRALMAVREFEAPNEKAHDNLFKFGFMTLNETVSNPSTYSTDCLHIIQSVCLYMLKKYDRIMSILKKKLDSTMKPLWCYLGSLSSLMLDDFSQSLGFVVMSAGLSIDGSFKSRFEVIHGCLLSKKGDYKGAIKCFGKASKISPCDAAAYYHMGEQYGKIGLIDEMVDCFRNVVKVKRNRKLKKHETFSNNFQTTLLNLLHPEDEISEGEALYAAAVACGVNEGFEESAKFFDEYLDCLPRERDRSSQSDKLIKTPGIVTALHEAATANIRTGNLIRARRLLIDASNHYDMEEMSEPGPSEHVHVTKDLAWIRDLLAKELGSGEATAEDDEIVLFGEDLLRVFDEDIIGLMLSAEVEKTDNSDAHKATLGRAITLLSRYLSRGNAERAGDETRRTTLLKAMSAKVCLGIAQHQIKMKKAPSEVEKTFKRALTCNQGDKDVLREYYAFLSREGKRNDAQKLWKSFRGKVTAVSVDQCQSLALRHILRNETSERELEEINMEVDNSFMDVDWS